MKYLAPTLLSTEHVCEEFSCRSEEQTRWLRRYALQASRANSAKVLVVTTDSSPHVVAYYAWSMAQIRIENAPARLSKGGGRYPQPVALLARLGVHHDYEGQGLGVGLMQDVMCRVASISESIGCRALLVHAESEEARNFYLHLIPEFEASPTNELHLTLLVKDIQKTLMPPKRDAVKKTK